MKGVIFPVIMAVSAVGGVMSADFARTALGGGGSAEKAASKDAHGKDTHANESKDSHGKKDDGAHGKAEGAHNASGEGKEYLNFKRQFVVPVVNNDAVDALILLNIGIETPAGKRDDMYRLEPRFRDAFIRELLQLSDSGYFDSELTSSATYEVIRETLYRAASEINNEGVSDVLILDLSRQDR